VIKSRKEFDGKWDFMIKIKNKHLTAHISKFGAEIKSLTIDGEEILWQGNEKTWARTAPTLFPFTGKFKDGFYIYGDEKYECPSHGFARNTEFTVEEKNKNSVTMLLTSSEETKAVFPFDFEFRVKFTLFQKSLIVEYYVSNTGDRPMYFSLGSHESYALENRVEDYDIIFNKKENLDNLIVGEGGLLTGEKQPVLRYSRILPLHDKQFDYDSLVFKNIASKSLILRNRTNGKRIKVEYPNSPNLVIWKMVGENYVCIEPWAGLPDFADCDQQLEHKDSIIKLKKNKIYKKVHKITILPKL